MVAAPRIAVVDERVGMTVLQGSRLTHRESYFDMLMPVIVSVIIALVAIIFLGSVFGSF